MHEIPYGCCHCGCGGRTTIVGKPRDGYKRGEPVKYIHGHQRRKPGPDYEVRDCGYTTPCWVWVKTKLSSNGYARESVGQGAAHRAYYDRSLPASSPTTFAVTARA